MEAGQKESSKDFNMAVQYTIPDAERWETVYVGRPGPFGIVRQASKVMLTHGKVFTLILHMLMLPLSIVTVVYEFVYYRGLLSRSFQYQDFQATFHGGAFSWLPIILVLLVATAVINIVREAAESLSSSAVLYAVGLHYTGRSVSFRGVLNVAVPRLWMRLTFTNLYKLLILSSFDFIFIVGCVIVYVSQGNESMPSYGLVGFLLALGIGSYCLEIIFMVAGSVSVLEKDYGWAAVTRSVELLKGRKAVAALFLLVWLVFVILSLVFFGFLLQPTQGPLPSLDPLGILVLSLYIYWITYVRLLKDVCTGVQYVSFKAYHNEDLAKSMYEKETAQKYEQSAIGDAEVGEQQVNDSKVVKQQRNYTKDDLKQITLRSEDSSQANTDVYLGLNT